MSRIKREYAYRTSDDEVFTGRWAKTRAHEHQEDIDLEINDEMLDEANCIFYRELWEEDSYERFLKAMNETLHVKCSSYEEVIRNLVRINRSIPEIGLFFDVIDSHLGKGKTKWERDME